MFNPNELALLWNYVESSRVREEERDFLHMDEAAIVGAVYAVAIEEEFARPLRPGVVVLDDHAATARNLVDGWRGGDF
jgi:hypothetical protein